MGDAREAGRVGVGRRKGCRGAGMPKMKGKSQRGRKEEEEEEEEEEGGHGREKGHGGGEESPATDGQRWSTSVKMTAPRGPFVTPSLPLSVKFPG